MSGLPRISGRECVKALSKVGFYLKRQESSHMILRRDNPFAQLVVPDHKNLSLNFAFTPADDGAGEVKQRQVVGRFLFPTDKQAAKAIDP